MRISSAAVIFLSALAVTGCGFRKSGAPISGSGLPTAQQAAQTPYKYGFTGQVIDASTHQAVTKFSVSLLGQNSVVNSIINALGSSNGIFHLSSNASSGSPGSTGVP